jgi:ubiquinone/menaquinone biosynthesis C-methylase UbiE
MNETETIPVSVVDHFDTLSATGKWSGLYTQLDGSNYHFHVRRQRVLELIPKKLGDVLDVGCGPGVMVEAVLARGGTFTGVDLSPEMIKESMALYGDTPGCRFLVGDVENIELPDASFDLVIAMAVLEYLNSPDRMFEEIGRVLRPGGLALITVPKRHHIDRLTVGLTTPFRKIAKLVVEPQSDTLPRYALQPDMLDAAAERFDLKFMAGRQYQFTPIPYPFTRLAPNTCMKANLVCERWTATRNSLISYFAHGYIGLYSKKEGASSRSE